MAGTPDWQIERVTRYYRETTEKSYLSGWAKDVKGFHFGLADEHTRSHAESLENTDAYLADRAQISQGSRVLDAGCGVGGSTLWLAKARAASVVGITLLEEQVLLARKFAIEEGLHDEVSFHAMDMSATTFPGQSFDVVWNIESLCHVVDVGAYLEHVAGLLRVGGRFVCIDLCRTDQRSPAIEQQVEQGWALAPLRSPQEVTAAMHAAGLSSVEHVDLTARAALSGQALRAMAAKTLVALRAEREFVGKEDLIYEGHVKAALAMVDGMEGGHTAVSHFRGVRQP